MTTMLTGYARCSTDEQDLTAQRLALLGLGVPADRIYMTRASPALTGNAPDWTRRWPLSVPATPWWCRSWTGWPDRYPTPAPFGDSLVARGVRLSLGGAIYDPTDPMGKMFFNILATFAEFEVDLLRLRTREGMATRPSQRQTQGQATQTQPASAGPPGRAAPYRRPYHC